MWDQWAIFYISGHKSQSLACKAPEFSMNNTIRPSIHIQNNSRIWFQEVAENLIWKKNFGSLVPHVWDQWTTGVGPLNHL